MTALQCTPEGRGRLLPFQLCSAGIGAYFKHSVGEKHSMIWGKKQLFCKAWFWWFTSNSCRNLLYRILLGTIIAYFSIWRLNWLCSGLTKPSISAVTVQCCTCRISHEVSTGRIHRCYICDSLCFPPRWINLSLTVMYTSLASSWTLASQVKHL